MHGLSPGLSDAISSITRWTFIKASFPHIMHACASALLYRKENNPGAKLSKTETKLLYTLHWLIIDAASECEDNAATQTVKIISATKRPSITSSTGPKDRSLKRRKAIENDPNKVVSYIHSVSTIQLFVYLFVPLLKTLTPDDLDNLKLSNGLKIWESLWMCRQPSIKIFNTPVKQKYEANGEQFIYVTEKIEPQPRKISIDAVAAGPKKSPLSPVTPPAVQDIKTPEKNEKLTVGSLRSSLNKPRGKISIIYRN